MIKVNHKLDFGVKTKFYSLAEFVKLEIDDKLDSLKLFIHVDAIEGKIEKFDVEKWNKFVTSEEHTIFEICIG